MDVKKAHKGLIDNVGRRKYFRELNPKLLEKPITIDVSSIKNKKKVLFIIPNFRWIDEDVNAIWDMVPWNLCQIAAVIEDISSEVKIIDAHKEKLSEDELAKQIADYKPDIAGITVLMDQYAGVAPITTKLIKNISKNIVTVLGGVYAMANPKER